MLRFCHCILVLSLFLLCNKVPKIFSHLKEIKWILLFAFVWIILINFFCVYGCMCMCLIFCPLLLCFAFVTWCRAGTDKSNSEFDRKCNLYQGHHLKLHFYYPQLFNWICTVFRLFQMNATLFSLCFYNKKKHTQHSSVQRRLCIHTEFIMAMEQSNKTNVNGIKSA